MAESVTKQNAAGEFDDEVQGVADKVKPSNPSQHVGDKRKSLNYY